jgi:chromosome segregation ATPase
MARLEAENQALREHAAELERHATELHRQLEARGIQAAPMPRQKTNPADAAARLESVRQLATAQQKLADAAATSADLQNRLHEAEAAVAQQRAEAERLAAENTERAEKLADARRIRDALENEMRVKNDRIAQMELAGRRSREESAAMAQRLEQNTALAREFDDLQRRSEATLNTLQRRYRDLTEQLRNIAGRLESQRDNAQAIAPEVSRIQNTVQMAEEDLRQLANLRAQAQRLAGKFTTK